MHVTFPELIQIITIDVAWTRQKNILPAARRMLAPGGIIISLIKPHYEAHASLLRKGILPETDVAAVIQNVQRDVESAGLIWQHSTTSPIRGSGGNTEVLAMLSASSGSA
jgi:23S rRNA (cytidine1920-2'-O)/16S rRNA (cytidine1409-2'-O)-methyltransferase